MTLLSSSSVVVLVVVMAFKCLLPVVITLSWLAGSFASNAAAAGLAADSSSSRTAATVKILAVFDQADMATMERVMHKTLIALNKEKTAWSSSSSSYRSRPSSALTGRATRQRAPLSDAPTALIVESVVFSVQWWINQTADDLGRLFVQHRPAAVLVLSSDEHSVFRIALAAAAHHLPIIGARARHGLDDSSFRVSRLIFILRIAYHRRGLHNENRNFA